MNDSDLPTAEMVLDTHEEIEDQYDLKYTGVRSVTPKTTIRQIMSDAQDFDSTYMRAGYMLRNLITEHIFEDANKRTAWTETREYLDRAGKPKPEREDAEKVLYAIRAYEVEEIADWLETGEIDQTRFHP